MKHVTYKYLVQCIAKSQYIYCQNLRDMKEICFVVSLIECSKFVDQ